MTAPTDFAAALAGVCGDVAVRQAGAGDTVGGREAKWITRPDSVGTLAALMRVCAERDLAVVARGEATKIDWGRPPTALEVVVDTGRLAGVHEHYPDDLVARVGAGTPLRAVQAALAKHNQRLTIDPGSTGATIGGILATGEAGPLRFGFGPPRDQLIGVEFVRADGTVAPLRRPGRQERRRVRPGQTSVRLVRYARVDHLGDVPGAPAAGRVVVRDPRGTQPDGGARPAPGADREPRDAGRDRDRPAQPGRSGAAVGDQRPAGTKRYARAAAGGLRRGRGGAGGGRPEAAGG